MSQNTGIRAKYTRYCPSVIEAMSEKDSRLLHRLRWLYQEGGCQSVAEFVYMCEMTRCVNDKLLTFNCLCPDCFIVWDVLSDEMFEWIKFNCM